MVTPSWSNKKREAGSWLNVMPCFSSSRIFRNQLSLIITTVRKTQTYLISFFYYMKIRIKCKSFFILIKTRVVVGEVVDLKKNPGYMPRSFLISKNVLPPIRIRSNPMMTEWSIGTNIVSAPNPIVDNDITYIE